MFTKDKTTGRGLHIRPFEVKKKVIDWDAIACAGIIIFFVLVLFGHIF